MKIMSVMPAAAASSTAYWISGLSTIGSISFGLAFVAGRKRVPRPATGNTAFVIFRIVRPSVDERLQRSSAAGLDELSQTPLVDHCYAELVRLVELASSVGAGDDVVRLARNTARDLAALAFDQCLRVLARERGERSGQHERHARQATHRRTL